jgi:hypothetical protein
MPAKASAPATALPNPQAVARPTPRVPVAVHGVQVNHCKNPTCQNFGVPVAEKALQGTNAYTIVATGAKLPAAKCNCCGEIFGLKSNQSVFEEAYRILAPLYGASSCPNAECQNHRVPTHIEGAYHEFGKTSIGSQRYRCKVCGKTFSVKPKGLNPISKQIHSDKNRTILSMLMGKMPLRRICEAAEVSPPVLYDKIDFLHKQAIAFLADRERALPSMKIERLYVGVDRQDHVINWSRRTDKRNVTLSSVAAADNATGYVFGMVPNFDPEPDPAQIEAMHLALGDHLVPACHRRHARMWLASDFNAAVAQSRRFIGNGTLGSNIDATYATNKARHDLEAPEHVVIEDKLPDAGMLIHADYTLHGFFVALRRMFENVEKVRFFLDQDSGIRAACLSAFAAPISQGACDVFYVRISKGLTVDDKRKLIAKSQKEFDDVAAAYPYLDKNGVKLMMLKDRIAKAQTIGPWKDRWVSHPLPTLSETDKAMCHLTDIGSYAGDLDHLAWLYNKASLHAVDSFFNRIRRRSSMLERPIHSSANRGRVYSHYSAYRPEQVNKIQTILRACHNYVWTGEGKKAPPGTPATRLGLAKAVLDLNDILYFR